MPLIERLMGLDEETNGKKIAVHAFQAIASEWARGRLTADQANAAIIHNCGQGLDAAERAEAQAIVGTVPGGSTTAQQVARAIRQIEIDQILLLADSLTPPYDTAAAVRARLGI